MFKFEHVEDGTQANHTDFLCKVPTFLPIIILIRVLVWREENDAMKEESGLEGWFPISISKIAISKMALGKSSKSFSGIMTIPFPISLQI